MKVRGLAAYFLPGLGNIIWMSSFLGVIGLGPRMMNIDGDLGRHLTIGEYILAVGRVPTSDLFSHTMLGQSLTPHEWLSQVIFALAYRGLGLNGVVLVCALVIAFSVWLVFRRALAKSHQVLLATAVAVLALAAGSLHWLARPHIFTFLMLALWIDSLERLRCGYLGSWWRLPVIMLLWANLHGAFIAGFVTWGIYGFGIAWDAVWKYSAAHIPARFERAFLLGGIVSFLATLMNPSGPGLWSTSIGYIGSRYLVSHTAEYLPPNFHDPSTWPFLLMLALTLAAFGLQARRVPAAQLFLICAWLVMALYSVRNVPLFAIVTAPPLASILSVWLVEHAPRLNLLARWLAMEERLRQIEISLKGTLWPAVLTLLVVVVLASGAALDFSGKGNHFDEAIFPVAAVDWMQDNPQKGEGFNYFPWGGYLLYRMWPEEQVFIDGQTDFYGESLTRQYEQVITLAPGWQQVFEQYHVRWVLIPVDEPLVGVLIEQPGWSVAYQDETAVLLARAE
jgi:hypothetical protein